MKSLSIQILIIFLPKKIEIILITEAFITLIRNAFYFIIIIYVEFQVH